MAELAVDRRSRSTLGPKLSVIKHPPKGVQQPPTPVSLSALYAGEDSLFLTGL